MSCRLAVMMSALAASDASHANTFEGRSPAKTGPVTRILSVDVLMEAAAVDTERESYTQWRPVATVCVCVCDDLLACRLQELQPQQVAVDAAPVNSLDTNYGILMTIDKPLPH